MVLNDINITRKGSLLVVEIANTIEYFMPVVRDDNGREFSISPFTGKPIKLNLVASYICNYYNKHKNPKKVDCWATYVDYLYYMPYKDYKHFTKKDIEFIENYGYSKTLLSIGKE